MISQLEKQRLLTFLNGSPIGRLVAQECQKLALPLYLCGGTVRDCLAGLENINDLDLYVETDQETFSKLISAMQTNIGIKGRILEDSLAAVDLDYCQDVVSHVSTFDFTANALAFNTATQILLDPTGLGVKHARERILVPTSKLMFLSAPRSHLRLFRLSNQRGFSISEDLILLLKQYSSFVLLADSVDACALIGELLDILRDERIVEILLKMAQTGTLERILPELSVLLAIHTSKFETFLVALAGIHKQSGSTLAQEFFAVKTHLMPFDKKYQRQKVIFKYSELALFRLSALLHFGFESLLTLDALDASPLRTPDQINVARANYFSNFARRYERDAALSGTFKLCGLASEAAQSVISQHELLTSQNGESFRRWGVLIGRLHELVTKKI